MSLWKRIKRKLKKGFSIRLFGFKVLVRVEKKNAAQSKASAEHHSPEQNDTFQNNFQFNMFVEHALDMEVKKKIISQVFYKNVGYYPNIDHPKTFSEKVLWLKLYYEDPNIEKACDKALGKQYIENVLGPGYTAKLLKTYDSVHDIDLDELPEKFALKVNWATGCNLIVTDKSTVNLDKMKNTLDRWTLPWKCSYYGSFNNGYRNVKPIIFAEEYLDIPHNSTEYKVFCANGKAIFTLIELDYFGKRPERAYYDRDFNEVPWQFGNIKKIQMETKPDCYDRIIELAEKIAAPFPYIRVDFYDLKDRLLIGELTFYSGGGFSILKPREWDSQLGDSLDLTEAMNRMRELGIYLK